MNAIFAIAPAAALAAAALSGCGQSAAEPGPGELHVVCTTPQITDIAQRIAGDDVRVSGLLGPGVDPHTYTLTRGDTALLSEADLVLYNGLLLEGKMTDTFISLATAGTPVVAVTEEIPESELIEVTGGHHDPHVWMDVSSWMSATEVIRGELIELAPEHSDAFSARADGVITELAALDAAAREALDTVPETNRLLITSHDAFNYFGRAYGFEVQGIQGLSTESEASLRDIEDAVDLLVERRIPAIFIETTIRPDTIESLVAGAAERGHTVEIGGELYSDSMGAPGTHEGTYVGMIEHNVTTVARALGGEVPEGGLLPARDDSPEEAHVP